jgi:iron complex outermembrane receptor protein
LTANSYISNLHLNDPGQINQPYQDHWYELRRRGADISLQHRTHRFQSELKIHHNSGVHEIYDGYRSQDQSTGFSLTETVIPNLGTRILLGVDYRYSGGKALIDKTWKEHYISENSIMAHLHQKLFGCFSLDGGVRYNQHSVVGSILIPAAGLTLHLPYQINIKIQYAQGFRNPSINELYLFLPSTTDLQPEQTANLELVVEKQYAGFLNTSLSLYQIKASNLIQKFGMPPLYHNTGEVIIHGLELEGRVLLPPQWVFQYGVSLMQTSTILAAAPSEKADVSVRYSPYTKFNITLQGQWVNNLFSLENPYSYGPVTYKRLDSYLLLNLRFNYQVGQHLQTYLSFENLTSVNYEVMYGFPMPGRSFTAGLSIYN